MPKTRLPYAPEFRRQMVELVRAGRTPEELAKEFEPTAQSIGNWVRQADRDEGLHKDGLTTCERGELTRWGRGRRERPDRQAGGGRSPTGHRSRPRVWLRSRRRLSDDWPGRPALRAMRSLLWVRAGY